MTTPPSALVDHPEESALILRLGAAVNAMRAALSWFLDSLPTPGPGGKRDRIATLLVATAYLKEALDRLLCPNYPRIVELARERGASDNLIRSLDVIMSQDKDSLHARVLKRTRNKLVFHWDEKPFSDWAKKSRKQDVTWIRGIGEKDIEAVYWASSDAIVASIAPGASADKLTELLQEVVEASNVLIEVFELAIGAFLNRHGAQFAVDLH